jgi:hypothetical protein
MNTRVGNLLHAVGHAMQAISLVCNIFVGVLLPAVGMQDVVPGAMIQALAVFCTTSWQLAYLIDLG